MKEDEPNNQARFSRMKMWAGLELSPLGSAHQHVDLTAATPRAHQPLAPLEEGHLRAVSPGVLSRIGLDLMLAGLAPDDEPRARRRVIGGVKERRRLSPRRFSATASVIAISGRGVIVARRSGSGFGRKAARMRFDGRQLL
jgi:hypothetical protein